MFTVDRDGNGVNDSEDDGIEPLGIPWEQRPVVSDVGTRLQAAIESSCKFTITCGPCLTYLRSLNATTIHDIDAITDRLLVQLQIPLWKRETIGDDRVMRIWLRSIIETVIVTPAG